MNSREDDLNDWLDALVQRQQAAPPSSIDRDLLEIATRVFGVSPAPPPSGFSRRLEATLMSSALSHTTTALPRPIIPGMSSASSVHPRQQPGRRIYAGVWGLLALILVVGSVMVNARRDNDQSVGIVAPSVTSLPTSNASASPVAASCPVPPRDRTAIAALIGSPVALLGGTPVGAVGSSLRPDLLPTGTPLSLAEDASLQATFSLWADCSAFASSGDAGARDRLYGLYTDDFFRRTSVSDDGEFTVMILPTPPDHYTISESRRLADGRIGVLLDLDYGPPTAPYFVVLRPGPDFWRIDEIVLVVPGPEPTNTPIPTVERTLIYCGEPYASFGEATVSGVTVKIQSVTTSSTVADGGEVLGAARVALRIENTTDDPVAIRLDVFAFHGCSDAATPTELNANLPVVADDQPVSWPMEVPAHGSVRMLVFSASVVPGTARIGEFTMQIVQGQTTVGVVTCPLAAETNSANNGASVGCSAKAGASGS